MIITPVPLATTALAGILMLAGDLGGTSSVPVVMSLTGAAGIVAAPTASLTFGATPATTSLLRFSNNTNIIAFRNAANSANLVALSCDASDNTILNGTGVLLQVAGVTVGTLASGGITYASSKTITIGTSGSILLGTSAHIDMPGTNLASAGGIRFPNGTSANPISTRNAANAADVGIGVDSNNSVCLGVVSVGPSAGFTCNTTTSGGHLVFNSAGLVWATGTTFTIKQADKTTASGTGGTAIFRSQNETGVTSTGGDVSIESGSGTSASGAVVLRVNTTVRFKANDTGIGFFNAAPVAQQSIVAAASDPATTQTLANSLRTAIINLGLGA